MFFAGSQIGVVRFDAAHPAGQKQGGFAIEVGLNPGQHMDFSIEAEKAGPNWGQRQDKYAYHAGLIRFWIKVGGSWQSFPAIGMKSFAWKWPPDAP